jgi:hypothetical protein
VLVRSLSPVLGHKVLYAHALSSWSGWVDPGIPLLLPTGPRSSSLMTSWVPDPLLLAVYFFPLFLVAVIGKGQLKNRHPKARHPAYRDTYLTGLSSEEDNCVCISLWKLEESGDVGVGS